MKILAHRGYWNATIPNNSPVALHTALEKGYGFESDVRDYQEKLVISHNVATPNSQKAEEIFQWLSEFSDAYPFAINIKADGLKDLLLELLRKYGIQNYFTFDMSVPQMVEFSEAGLVYFTRQSEVEAEPVLYDRAAGVWIDGFWGSEWITSSLLARHLAQGKTVCLVSPDLHKRPFQAFWERLAGFDLDFSKVLLCTDYPDEAAHYFRDKE